MKAKMAGVILLTALSCWPTATGRVRFLQLSPLSISAEKSHPPYIAFSETERLKIHDEWELMSRRPATGLSTDSVLPQVPTRDPRFDLAKNDVTRLPVMRIEKPGRIEMAELQAEEAKRRADAEWLETLPKAQRERVARAQRDSNVLNEEWSSPDWTEAAKQIVARQEAIDAEGARKPAGDGIVIGRGLNADGTVSQPARDVARVVIDENAAGLEIAGRFELHGGSVALFDPSQYFEIVRMDGGIEKDKGLIDAEKASYRIRLSGRSGEVFARLRDSEGRILGEDSFKLSRLTPEARGHVQGPKFVLTAKTSVAGTVASYAASNDKGFARQTPAVTVFGERQDAKGGSFEFSDVQKGSMAVLRAEAKNHYATLALVSSGVKSDLPVFPRSWVETLKQIVSEQRQVTFSPDVSIVWGKVVQDGSPRAGVTVDVESAPGIEAVYFNIAMIPDSNLKVTSENGLFALIGTPAGFHSLVAKIGGNYYSHQNVVVEPGAVSLVDLESTIRTEQVPLQLFDAFTGSPRPAFVLHQAVDGGLEVDESGAARLQMPVLHRTSLIQVRPELPYAPATYLIADDTGFVHLPLVRDDWVRALQVWAKIDDVPDSAVAVGFVMDEDFTVEAFDPERRTRTVYFDQFGNPTATGKGVAGGGFALFGLSRDVQEILVRGERTGMLGSRVIPADSRTLTVLTFRSE